MYFVTSIWRGAMRVNDMRIFPTEAEAWRYADSTGDTMKVYEVSSDNFPRLCKKPKPPTKVG